MISQLEPDSILTTKEIQKSDHTKTEVTKLHRHLIKNNF